MMPGQARRRHPLVEERTRKLTEWAETASVNRVEMGGTGMGVITSSTSYQYVKEVFGDSVSVLKLGMVNPLPVKLIKEFAAKTPMLMDDLAVAGGVALAKALRLMAAGKLPPEVPQDEMYATHVKKLRKTDGLIVWDSPVIEIERRIRAYNPWPGCFTFLPERFRKKGNAGRLVITKARIVKSMEPGWTEAPAGTIVKLGPVVKCHDTALQLLEVKPEGSSTMSGGALLRGRALRAMEDVL